MAPVLARPRSTADLHLDGPEHADHVVLKEVAERHGSPRSCTSSYGGSQRLRQAPELVGRRRPGQQPVRPGLHAPREPQVRAVHTAIVRGVDLHQDLLRAAIASGERPPSRCERGPARDHLDLPRLFLNRGGRNRAIIEGRAPQRRRRVHHPPRRDQPARAAPGHHGPEPDLAVRLHRQQVRVPRRRLDAVSRSYPAAFLNTILAESLDHIADAIEAAGGPAPRTSRRSCGTPSRPTSGSCSRGTTTRTSGARRPRPAGCSTVPARPRPTRGLRGQRQALRAAFGVLSREPPPLARAERDLRQQGERGGHRHPRHRDDNDPPGRHGPPAPPGRVDPRPGEGHGCGRRPFGAEGGAGDRDRRHRCLKASVATLAAHPARGRGMEDDLAAQATAYRERILPSWRRSARPRTWTRAASSTTTSGPPAEVPRDALRALAPRGHAGIGRMLPRRSAARGRLPREPGVSSVGRGPRRRTAGGLRRAHALDLGRIGVVRFEGAISGPAPSRAPGRLVRSAAGAPELRGRPARRGLGDLLSLRAARAAGSVRGERAASAWKGAARARAPGPSGTPSGRSRRRALRAGLEEGLFEGARAQRPAPRPNPVPGGVLEDPQRGPRGTTTVRFGPGAPWSAGLRSGPREAGAATAAPIRPTGTFSGGVLSF